MFDHASTRHALSLLGDLDGQMRKGLTLGKAKYKHHKFSAGIDLKIFPEHIAELWDWCQGAETNRQFRTRLRYFLAMAGAFIDFLQDNEE